MKDIQDAVVTVMGLGRLKKGSGVGATKWLLRHGAQVVITDLRDEKELDESVAEVMQWFTEYKKMYPDREIYHPLFVLGEHREENFSDVNMVVINPDVPHDSPFLEIARQNNVPVESDTSLFFRFCPFPVIGVTGARGKTLTAALTGELCKAANEKTIVAGNMRLSPLEYLDEIMEATEPMPIVLELSSWLLESINHLEVGPKVGVFTNIYADHLGRYEGVEGYLASKKNIFAKSGADGVAVLNKDQDVLAALSASVPGKTLWFSGAALGEGEEGAYVKDGTVIVRVGGVEESVMPVSEIKIEGEDNLHNVLSAVVVAKLNNVPVTDMKRVITEFSTNDDRQEIVTDVSGVIYVNDALGSSPDLTIKVLQRFGERGRSIHLISGGDIIEGELGELVKKIKLVSKSVILLPGAGSDKLEKAIGKTEETDILRSETMSDAVKMASELATSGDGVIFSPALGYTDAGTASKLGDEFATSARALT